MRFIAAFLLTALLCFLAGVFLQWWGIAIAAFIVAIAIHQRAWKAYLSAFLAVFVVWALIAWWRDSANEGLLSKQVAELFSLGSSILLIIVSSVIGALVAGFAAMSGSYLRGLVLRK